MVVVDGIRYRPEDAPKQQKDAETKTEQTTEAEHKMRTPRRPAAKKS